MKPQNKDDLVERFSMGRLQGGELTDYETHLPQCVQCQDAVRRMELLLEPMRSPAEHSRQSDRLMAGLPVATGFKGQYLLVQAALPNTSLLHIGVLLIDVASDRLSCRFRRDFEEFAGGEADWFKELSDYISQGADELGAEKCVEWLESTLSNVVQMSTRKRVLIEHCAATTVARLYAKLIQPKVLPFRTHLPQYSLEAAAGRFGRQMVVEPEGWVEVWTDISLADDMFVAHVDGHSMEPKIPYVCLCAFRSKIAGSMEGKVLLLEHCNEFGGGNYTVKLVQLSKAVDPIQEGDPAWLHQRLTLESINPAYRSWDVGSDEKIRIVGEFLFVV